MQSTDAWGANGAVLEHVGYNFPFETFLFVWVWIFYCRDQSWCTCDWWSEVMHRRKRWAIGRYSQVWPTLCDPLLQVWEDGSRLCSHALEQKKGHGNHNDPSFYLKNHDKDVSKDGLAGQRWLVTTWKGPIKIAQTTQQIARCKEIPKGTKEFTCPKWDLQCVHSFIARGGFGYDGRYEAVYLILRLQGDGSKQKKWYRLV